MTIIFSNMGDRDCELLPNIWKDIDDVKVVEITKDTENAEEIVDEAIAAETDTIMFCGHGDIFGLYFPSWMSRGYLLHENNANLVKAKNVICIWCWANYWVEAYKEKLHEGHHDILSSGMFISNCNEARFNGYEGYTQEAVDETNCVIYAEMNECLKKNLSPVEWLSHMGEGANLGSQVDVYNRGHLVTYSVDCKNMLL